MLKAKHKIKNTTIELDNAVYVPSEFAFKKDKFIRVGYEVYETKAAAEDPTKPEIDEYDFKITAGEDGFSAAQAQLFDVIETFGDTKLQEKDEFIGSQKEKFYPE